MSGETFIVRDCDLEFYEKISPEFNGKKYLIPPPALCPRERERRRLTYRNERKLYKRFSSLSGKPIISFFSPNSPYTVYAADEWWGDKWDAMNFGRDFNFERGFFEQFYELQLAVPRPPLVNNKAENSDYCNFADINKNCYLLTSSNRNRDSYYGFILIDSRDCVDCTFCTNSELLYECVDCQKCYNLNYCQNCENCIESMFLLNCAGAQNCFMCVSLHSKERYHILNKPFSKEDYEKEIRAMRADREHFLAAWRQFCELSRKFPVKALNTVSCENAIGDYIFNSRDIYSCFTVYDSENLAYSHEGVNAENCQDICFFDSSQWCYESTSLMGYGYRFTNFCRDSADLFYCDNCHGCKNCFGCIGLRKKEYCIFNKQYDKESYERLAAAIIQHMTRLDQWGEFFPVKYSLFGYGETLAQDFFPANG